MVTKLLGNGTVELICCDGLTRRGIIRGVLMKKRKVWIRPGDFVLISLRSFDPGNADIFHRYVPEEVIRLRSEDVIPMSMNPENFKKRKAIKSNSHVEDLIIDFSESCAFRIDEEEIMKKTDWIEFI
jgi:initiation factor 1A